jgi:hypothetical protein
MSRPIEVVVQGYYTKVDKKPKNPPAWYAEYLRMRRYPEFRMVIVRYKGEQVLVGALDPSAVQAARQVRQVEQAARRRLGPGLPASTRAGSGRRTPGAGALPG